MENEVFDILILGGGVAGVTASVYAKRRNKKVAIVEEMLIGGQLASINEIENFPSYDKVTGFELMQNFQKQVKYNEIPVFSDVIEKVDFSKDIKVVFGKRNKFFAKSVIIATGLTYKKLGKNEDEFLGRGVSYCAICDANFYKNQEVAVVSKKGSGILGALQLADVCKKVYFLDSEDMTIYAKACPKKNIEVISNVEIINILGEGKVDEVEFKVNDNVEKLKLSALFIELGKRPLTDIYKSVLKLDDNGYIVTNEKMETSVKGVFACGDIRAGVLKQLVSACADGAIAGQFA